MLYKIRKENLIKNIKNGVKTLITVIEKQPLLAHVASDTILDLTQHKPENVKVAINLIEESMNGNPYNANDIKQSLIGMLILDLEHCKD